MAVANFPSISTRNTASDAHIQESKITNDQYEHRQFSVNELFAGGGLINAGKQACMKTDSKQRLQ